MFQCSLCGQAVNESDLSKYYLNDKALISYIEAANPNWKPEMGACSRCLETFYNEYISGSLSKNEEVTEEKTVITADGGIAPKPELILSTPSLILIHGVDLGKKYDLVHDQTLIGRGETAHIRINEENVSRLHAIITKEGSNLVIADQKSTNGTFVNTRKIESKPLRDGDLILIGNTIMKFMSGSSVEHQYHEEIYRLATLDGLTQIYNKNFFLDRLTDEFSRSKRYDRDLSLLLFDFDHFKAINDTYGHLAGDEILKQSAALLQKNMRKEDVCGRYGGEEFGVILPETPSKYAMQLAEKLRKLVEATEFKYTTLNIPVTISIGVASLLKNVKSPGEFLVMADRALYEAKKSGRNCVKLI